MFYYYSFRNTEYFSDGTGTVELVVTRKAIVREGM